jgi:hypothetical protein
MPASDVDVVVTNLPDTAPWVRGNGGGQHLLQSLADHLSTQVSGLRHATHHIRT